MVLTDRFKTNPLKIVIIDPNTNTNVRTYVMVGKVPSVIRTALREYTTKKSLSAANKRVLAEFYGDKYEKILGIDVKNQSAAFVRTLAPITGGGMKSSLESDVMEMLRMLKTDASAQRPDHGRPVNVDDYSQEIPRHRGHFVQSKSARETTILDIDEEADLPQEKTDAQWLNFSDICVFSEDKFSELKTKIQMATGIPLYRQHLYYISDSTVEQCYRIYTDYTVFDTDILHYRDGTINVLGMPIDKNLYDCREDLFVDAFDGFRCVNSVGVDNTVYVVDLQDILSKSHTIVTHAAKHDVFQFEMVYYGFILKYWPMLTLECFRDLMLDPHELQHKYPDLVPSRTVLSAVQQYEAEIINADYDNASKISAFIDSKNMSIAIVEIFASVKNSRVVMNIRNLFDQIQTSDNIPEIHAYVEHGGAKYILRKRHTAHMNVVGEIQFPSGIVIKTGITFAIMLGKEASTGMKSNYLFLTIHPTGKYFIKAYWPEEREMRFDDVMAEVSAHVNKLIGHINTLHKYAFVTGTKLEPVTEHNIYYQGLNICIYWKKVMHDASFKALRAMWEPYIRAGIVAPRPLQQYDKFEVLFCKGMYDFDSSVIYRTVEASNNMILHNQYQYLSNSLVKQKWDQNYRGRIVSMIHRTADVRFMISDTHEAEFNTFLKFIAGFVMRAGANPSLAGTTQTASAKVDKKIRRLREADPELYNHKKYSGTNTYSILCQNPHQPIIYTDDEIKNLDAKDKKSLVKYWNFTTQTPAWYGCPSREFPHLSFIVGKHPRGYCFPCCSIKNQSSEGSSKKNVYDSCMTKHTFDEDGMSNTSRHIIQYGKVLDLGRLSHLSPALAELFGANYYMYGVEQNTASANNVGAIFACADVLGMSVPVLIKTLTNYISTELLYTALLGGSIIEYFPTADLLIAAMKNTFVSSAQSLHAERFWRWNELITELLFVALNIIVVFFVDETGEMIINDAARMSATNNTKYIVLVKLQEMIYPIYNVIKENYNRNLQIEAKSFDTGSHVEKLLGEMIASETSRDTQQAHLDFAAIVAAAPVGSVTGLVNLANMVYAVEIKHSDAVVTIPVNYSVPIKQVRLSTTPADILPDFGTVQKCVSDLNARLPASYNKIELGAGIRVNKNGVTSIIGVRTQLGIIYCTGVATENVETLSVDPREINKILATPSRKSAVHQKLMDEIGHCLYINYQYNLFVAEFINFVDSERDEDLRAKIFDVFTTKSADEANEFIRKLDVSVDDRHLLSDQLVDKFYKKMSAEKLKLAIQDAHYEFDKTTLVKVRKLDAADALRELRTTVSKFAVEGELGKNVKFPNVYMPCRVMNKAQARDSGYCENDRLIVQNIDKYSQLLLADLKDAMKTNVLMTNVWTDTFVDFFRFVPAQGQVIDIYKMDQLW